MGEKGLEVDEVYLPGGFDSGGGDEQILVEELELSYCLVELVIGFSEDLDVSPLRHYFVLNFLLIHHKLLVHLRDHLFLYHPQGPDI